MINTVFKYLFLVTFVFVQVFFVDSFEFKFGLLFLPLFYYFFKSDLNSMVNYGFLIFIFYDFFKNNFVGISLGIYLILNLAINQLSKIWGKEIIIYMKFIITILVFYIMNFGILSSVFLNNLIIFVLIIFLWEVRRSGYFRFN